MIRNIYHKLQFIQCRIDSWVTKFFLKLQGIKFGSIKSHGLPIIVGKKVSIGNNLSLNNTLKSNPVGFAHRCYIASYGGEIKIGDNVGMSHVTIIAANKITIGDGTVLGGGTNIYDTDFHSMDYRKRGNGNDLQYAISKPIHIGKNVFVGTNVTILKGVTIGDNVVIGACSLVTKDIPSNEMWAGVPAKFIKEVGYDDSEK